LGSTDARVRGAIGALLNTGVLRVARGRGFSRLASLFLTVS